jgi:alcohol dehydrogenase class IV
VAALAGLAAAQLIAAGFSPEDAAGVGGDAGDEAARDGLALAALLAGYAIGSAGYGLHHVVSQTLARFAWVPHGAANTIMLPYTTEALARRAPAWTEQLSSGLGSAPVVLARRLLGVSELNGLRAFGVSEDDLEVCARQASERPELALTPPPADLEELRGLYWAAF